MSDIIIVDGKPVSLEKVEGRVIGSDRKEKLKYLLRHNVQKADIVNKGIDEKYIEVRQNENRANGTPVSEASLRDPAVDLKLTIGGKEPVQVSAPVAGSQSS